MIDYKAIGKRIKIYRKNANLTQFELAEELGITDKYLSQIECGSAKISLTRLFEVSKPLGITPEQLIADIDPSSSDYLKSQICEKLEGLSAKKRKLILDLIDVIIIND